MVTKVTEAAGSTEVLEINICANKGYNGYGGYRRD
jgi:hypothetical protein